MVYSHTKDYYSIAVLFSVTHYGLFTVEHLNYEKSSPPAAKFDMTV